LRYFNSLINLPVIRPDRFPLKLFSLTPGYCRAPLFDEKKRGFVKKHSLEKHNKFSVLNSTLFLSKERSRG
jgi:hypothetical protein